MSTDKRRNDALQELTGQPDHDIEREHRNAHQSGEIFTGQQWLETRTVLQEGGQI